MKKRISSSFPDQNFQQGRGGGGRGGGADGYGLDLTCNRRAATVSGDGEWRRRVATSTASGDVDGEWRRGRRRATELLERRLGSLLPRFRSIFLLFFPFLVQEKICSLLRFDRD